MHAWIDVWNRHRDTLREWVPSLVLLPVCLFFVLNRGRYTFLDHADLIIHEAGHFVFRFFGPVMHVLGGTLMQILLPSILVGHFLIHHYRFGVQLSLLWLGHNFINISVYAGDARARVLPLLGGSRSIHDWHYLLGRAGWLEADALVSDAFFAWAVVCFVLLVLLPLRMMGE
ncbi:MAG: hypothetical protein D6685_18220 [Bacteroidetes bacterium]|nr:hypothetical protein AWN76_008750 [Rhodothermaceae bacterium RA]RMH50322.1 MAG: hypothetical protein D6685_18220 [Bacteroidota bacterium]